MSNKNQPTHKWFAFQVKAEFVLTGIGDTYRRIEYAYVICQSCSEPHSKKIIVDNMAKEAVK